MSSSSFPAVSILIPILETATIPSISSNFEAAVVTNSPSPSPATHITLPMPFPIVTQTSSLVSMVARTSYTIESRDEFNEDIVISLGDYHYSKSNKVVVKKGKKRSRDEGDMDTSLSKQIVWTQQSGGP